MPGDNSLAVQIADIVFEAGDVLWVEAVQAAHAILALPEIDDAFARPVLVRGVDVAPDRLEAPDLSVYGARDVLRAEQIATREALEAAPKVEHRRSSGRFACNCGTTWPGNGGECPKCGTHCTEVAALNGGSADAEA